MKTGLRKKMMNNTILVRPTLSPIKCGPPLNLWSIFSPSMDTDTYLDKETVFGYLEIPKMAEAMYSLREASIKGTMLFSCRKKSPHAQGAHVGAWGGLHEHSFDNFGKCQVGLFY